MVDDKLSQNPVTNLARFYTTASEVFTSLLYAQSADIYSMLSEVDLHTGEKCIRDLLLSIRLNASRKLYWLCEAS